MDYLITIIAWASLALIFGSLIYITLMEAGLRVINTAGWAEPPPAHYPFRVGRTRYACIARIGHYALVLKEGEL